MGAFTLQKPTGGSALRDGDVLRASGVELVGQITTAITATASLHRDVSLAGSIAVQVTVSGSIDEEPLVGAIAATTTASASLTRDHHLSGATSATVSLDAVLTGGQGVPLVRHVREKPPLRLSHEIISPTGRHYRWGADEPRPENVPSGHRFSSTMPGGFESQDAVLPRVPGRDYPDLERLSTWISRGAGGEVACETRLERTPRTSGNQMAISPSSVGWQAHLEDDKSAAEIYVDRDFTAWRGPSVARRLSLISGGFHPIDASVQADQTNGQPSLALEWTTGNWAANAMPDAEGWYDAGERARIGSIYTAWKKSSTLPGTPAYEPFWNWGMFLTNGDNLPYPPPAGSFDYDGDNPSLGPGSGTLVATAEDRRFALAVHFWNGGAGQAGDQVVFGIYRTVVAVYGSHGLTKRGSNSFTDAQGLWASDIVAHAVSTFAPLLNYSEGEEGSIRPSDFVIPHLAFRERTTAGEIIRQATRFGLQDWGVWEDKTFCWNARGERGRSWRARTSPAQLEETGPQVDRLWNSVIVQFQDVDGTTHSVGPPGSGADTEDENLRDDDPLNPANQLGVVRREILTMGTSTPAGAAEVGGRFLEQQRLLDSSGKAQLVGYVEDSHGVVHPAWNVRAGDSIVFSDAADPSPRRVVRADYDAQTRTCSVDLDAPPEGLAALLDRLGVVLAPLGLH